MDLGTTITLLVTTVLVILGGVAGLINRLLSDVYKRLEEKNDKILAIDRRLDTLQVQYTKEFAALRETILSDTYEIRNLASKIQDLRMSQENLVDIVKEVLLRPKDKDNT